MQIEIVTNVVFVHFDEELMALEVAEPLDPARARLALGGGSLVHVVCSGS